MSAAVLERLDALLSSGPDGARQALELLDALDPALAQQLGARVRRKGPRLAQPARWSDEARLDLGARAGTLDDCRKLFIYSEQAFRLGPSIGRLRALADLRIQHTWLRVVPDELRELTGLRTLILGSNRIERLPDLAPLQQLHRLDLWSNRLPQVPTGLRGLPLTQLVLGHNPIQSFPDIFSSLPTLKRLNLHKCGLSSLPDSVFQLPELHTLQLGENPLARLPRSFGEASALRHLDLEHQPLSVLPAAIGQLSQLRELRVSHTPLTHLPPTLGDCRALRRLQLRDTAIRSLPADLELPELAYLDIFGTGIERLPEALAERAARGLLVVKGLAG